ncbi:MAG: twin-arginine translocation signal domain-containing protein [Halioglobus sp.]|nr:twin-arginine translocation signal domain-containing protein [Halioglobus sp.]
MGISRRVFIKHSATAGAGLALAGCGNDNGAGNQVQAPVASPNSSEQALAQSAVKATSRQLENLENVLWREVVPWEHAWDAADAITYVDDGKNFDLEPATRVDRVPDLNGGRDLMRDDGSLLAAFDIPRIPGTLYSSGSDIFGGRPSWFSDTIMSHEENTFPYFYAMHSCLTMKLKPEHEFRWPQPWWGAVLARGVAPFEGHNHAYIDGNPGMTTIGISKKNRTVQMRAWPDGTTFGPTIDTGLPYSEDTVLVMWSANDKESWLELSFRNAAGEVITRRTHGAIANSLMENFHSGFSHTNHTTCIGLSRGVPTQADTDRVVAWAAPYLPEALVLA